MKFHSSRPKPDTLRIVSLGGFGKVTTNMFVYETAGDILLIDCGMGFPTAEMLGVDILIPDISYLFPKLDKIRGLVLTHGHEDHTGALPYLLPKLGQIPVFASRLTAHLVMDKLAEYENLPHQVNVLQPNSPLRLGQFQLRSVHVTHSIPDATNLIITTPLGRIYHGSDFKFDLTPVDGLLPDIGQIAAAGAAGVKLLLSDCLGSQRRGYTPSEKSLEDMLEREVSHCPGKFLVTSMGSNISRWYQAAAAAIRHGRKVAIAGRSIDRNIKVASALGFFNLPSTSFVDISQIKKLPPQKVCILIAGSQAQPGSALEKVSLGDHKDITIGPDDKVVFSSDYIPGSEAPTQSLIDTLAKLGAKVVYSEITDDLHVSGHGSQQDLLLMLALTRPQFVLPIGGTYRHMVQYSQLAQNYGLAADRILLPNPSQTIEVTSSAVRLGPSVNIRNVMVDGLGVGDVGHIVLRDRQKLAEEGLLVAVVEVDQNDLSQIVNIDLTSRGFVFAGSSSPLLSQAEHKLRQAVSGKKGRLSSEYQLRQVIIEVLERFLYDRTHRRPMILPVVVQV